MAAASLPLRDGVGASRVVLPPGAWPTVLAFLVERFPHIDIETWRERMARGLVCDAAGQAITPDTEYRAGLGVQYYRELTQEPVIAGAELILFQDEHLLVADKPHGLAVIPGGRYARETLLARLRQRLQVPDLAPLHRLDRDTAGVIAFSTRLETRGHYQELLRTQQVDKVYEALAAPLPGLEFPVVRRSCIVRGDPFFRMQEVEGEPNSETRIEVAGRGAHQWLYRLHPRTGKKHQLRVHMAALGAGIRNDPLYPQLQLVGEGAPPLQLLARELAFDDPLTGERRVFRSGRELDSEG